MLLEAKVISINLYLFCGQSISFLFVPEINLKLTTLVYLLFRCVKTVVKLRIFALFHMACAWCDFLGVNGLLFYFKYLNVLHKALLQCYQNTSLLLNKRQFLKSPNTSKK